MHAITSRHGEADPAELRILEPSPLEVAYGQGPVTVRRVSQQHAASENPAEDDEVMVAVDVDGHDDGGKIGQLAECEPAITRPVVAAFVGEALEIEQGKAAPC
jgi:hypothetical protein